MHSLDPAGLAYTPMEGSDCMMCDISKNKIYNYIKLEQSYAIVLWLL